MGEIITAAHTKGGAGKTSKSTRAAHLATAKQTSTRCRSAMPSSRTRWSADRFEVPLFRNKIPEDAKFGDAHLVGLPVGADHHGARSATAYRHVAYELIQRRGWRFTVPEMV